MVSFFLKAKLYFAILVTVALIYGGIFSWQYRVKHKGKTLSDQQMVWLLVGLLVIAIMSMGVFLVVLLGGIESWNYFRI